MEQYARATQASFALDVNFSLRYSSPLYIYNRLTLGANGQFVGSQVGPLSEVTSDPSIVSGFEIVNPYHFEYELGASDTRVSDERSPPILLSLDEMIKITVHTPWVFYFSFPYGTSTSVRVEQGISFESSLIPSPLHNLILSIAQDGRSSLTLDETPTDKPTLHLVNPYNVPLLFSSDPWAVVTSALPTDPYPFDLTGTTALSIYQRNVVDPSNPAPTIPPWAGEIDPDDPFGDLNEWINETADAIEQAIIDAIEKATAPPPSNEPEWYATPVAITVWVILGLVLILGVIGLIVANRKEKPKT
jgi:hypothetical protein